jgi:hypothetical protein
MEVSFYMRTRTGLLIALLTALAATKAFGQQPDLVVIVGEQSSPGSVSVGTTTFNDGDIHTIPVSDFATVDQLDAASHSINTQIGSADNAIEKNSRAISHNTTAIEQNASAIEQQAEYTTTLQLRMDSLTHRTDVLENRIDDISALSSSLDFQRPEAGKHFRLGLGSGVYRESSAIALMLTGQASDWDFGLGVATTGGETLGKASVGYSF